MLITGNLSVFRRYFNFFANFAPEKGQIPDRTMSFHCLSSIPGFNSMPTPLGKWKGRLFTQVSFNSVFFFSDNRQRQQR